MGRALTGLFRVFRDGGAQERRRALKRLLIIFGVVKLIVVTGCLALLGTLLWVEWPRLISGYLARQSKPDPLPFLLLSCIVLALELNSFNLIALFSTYGSYSRILPAQTFARALSGAIAAGDPASAPRVATEPGVPEPGAEPPVDRTTEAETIGPLAHPARSTAPSNRMYTLVALGGVTIACFGVAVALIPVMIGLPSSSVSFQPASLLDWGQALPFLVMFGLLGINFFLLGCGITAWALVTRRYARMERQGFTARMDAESVTIQRPGLRAPERLRWADIQGFARLHYRDDLLREHEAYLLIGANSDLLWEAPPLSRYVSPQETQHEEALRAAAYRLAEDVAQRVQAPLRDVSAAVRDALPNATGDGPSSQAWNVAERATYYARVEGDDALAAALWERLHPGKRLPGLFRLSMSANSVGVAKPSHAQVENLLRVARALLPYYLTPAQMARELRTRFLSRGYWRYEITLQVVVFTWIVAYAILVILTYLQWRQRFG